MIIPEIVCPKCRCDGCVEVIETGKKKVFFCNNCGKEWT
jgi:uncharacterized Zn finger protein